MEEYISVKRIRAVAMTWGEYCNSRGEKCDKDHLRIYVTACQEYPYISDPETPGFKVGEPNICGKFSEEGEEGCSRVYWMPADLFNVFNFPTSKFKEI